MDGSVRGVGFCSLARNVEMEVKECKYLSSGRKEYILVIVCSIGFRFLC